MKEPKNISLFVDQILKGLGQIMLQENRWTGLLFLAGITYGDPWMGLAALAATTVGTLTAVLLHFDTKNTDKGLYGFSPALVGVAIILFFPPVLSTWIFIGIGSVMAAGLQHFFLTRNIPVFTLPFVGATWLLLLAGKYFLPEVSPAAADLLSDQPDFLGFILRGYGQVIFQEKLLSGILFFIGVAISSRRAALFGLAASFLAGSAALLLSLPLAEINMGLFGFNAVLCAILFSGSEKKNFLQAGFAVSLAFLISIFMLQYHLIQLTFPFVAASMLTTYTGRTNTHFFK